jgi:hypothetical protein
METLLGLLAIASGIGIPIYLQRKEHPRRELRYAVNAISAAETSQGRGAIYSLRIWSTSRADISSMTFDDGRDLVFSASQPLMLPIEETSRGGECDPLCLLDPFRIALKPQLLHTEFDTRLCFYAPHPFFLQVVNPLIDVRVVRDAKVEAAGPSREQRAVARTRKKAHVSLFGVGLSLTVFGFVLLILGVSLSYVDEALGAQFGIPSILILPVAIPMLIISGVRALASSINADQAGREPERSA